MIFLLQHPERRERRENTETYGLYECGSSGVTAPHGISLSRSPATAFSGLCLVTKITATVKTPNGDVKATSYTSSGTSYSQYAVINYGDGNNFQVTRRVS